MKIKRLVVGTSNPAKFKEWKLFLEGKIPVISISEIGSFPEAEENGKTFEENAIQKAEYYSKLSKEYVLSEDGGFEVDFLDGLPGIKSRRILPGGKDGTDQQLIAFILKKLDGVPEEKRTARLVVYVVVSDPKGNIFFRDNNSVEGVISEKPSKKVEKGYPYRSILFLPQVGKLYIDLTKQEHMKIAHREPIAERLVNFLLEYK